jgi:hypothetical protein
MDIEGKGMVGRRKGGRVRVGGRRTGREGRGGFGRTGCILLIILLAIEEI